MNDKGKMPMNSAARNDLSSRRCVRLPILIAAMLIVISTVFTGSGLTGTAQAQAERGAIPSVSLDSNEPGQLVITRQTPDPAPTDYRISWAHSSLGFLSYRDSNEAQRGNAYPSGNENTLTLDGLTPGEIYKVQLRARYYTANRSAHEWSGPWTGTSTTRVMDEPAKPPPPEETPQPAEQTENDDPPAAPTGLTVARVGHSVLTLSWNDPQDERITGYRVLRGASVDSLSTIEENTGGVGTEYADDTVAPETTYHYAVIALSAVGDGAQSDAVSATTTAAPKPKKQPTPESARQSTTPTEVPTDWTLKPTAVAAGAKFRLLFLSSTKRNAMPTTISNYNTFVQGLAAAGHANIRAYSAGFRAVGCTSAVDARDNTGTRYTSSDKGVPIYWLDGNKVADDYEDFYDGSWDDEANDKNESGIDAHDTSQSGNYPFTGCANDGTEEFAGATRSRALGAALGFVRIGRLNTSGNLQDPLDGNDTARTSDTRPMYGLSGVFLVSDSPSSMEPAAVSDVVVVPVPHTTDSLQVSWSAPDNTGKPALTGYDVRYKLDSPLVSVWTVERQAASSTSVTIDGLNANDYMFVQVRAVNAEEDGPWSSTAEALTSPSPEVVLANHPLVPDDLDPGDSFRLLFVTSATKAASGTGIHDYNIFVSDPAFKLLESGNLLEQWDSIGVGQRPLLSLPGAHARLITDTTWTETDRGVPIYWLNGARVADDYADFYDGTWADEANPTNGLGNARSLAGTAPWTGTNDDGTELFDGAASRAVGQASVSVGGLGSTIPGAGPLNGGAAFASTQERPLYGLWHVMVVDEDLRLGSNSLSAPNATRSSDNRAAVRAQLFTTGSHSGGYGISLIEFFEGWDEDDVDDPSLGTVALYTTDTNGDPDLANGLHATLSVVSTSSSSWGLAAPVGTVLKPSTTYALVFQGDGSLYPYLVTTNIDGEDLPSAGWSIADVLHYWSGTSWVANSNGQALTMKILGPRLEDTEGPALDSATVVAAGNAVTLVFGEDVTLPSDSAEALTFLASLASAFAVTGGGDDVTVSALTADSANPEQLTIVLSGVILQGQAVTLTYTDPTAGDDAVALQDVLGNDAPTFTTGMDGVPAVTNNSTVNTPATGAPTITGTAQVGQTLTAVTTAIMDANGLTSVSYAYQWIRVATDNTETNIASATASTYTLVDADLGTTIKVKVSFTDDASNAETLTSAATAAVAVAAAPTAVPAGWNLKPTSLTTGDKFRLLFLSSTKRDGSSTDIAVYNTFVQGRAAAGHADIRAYSAGFRAVGCTADTAARDNTSTTYTDTDKGVPIYWLDGAKAADEYEDFYDGSWDDEVNDKNESGTNGPDTSQLANYPFTGCDHDGTEAFNSSNVSRALGMTQGSVGVGRPNSSVTYHGPIGSGSVVGPASTHPMYGLSGVFQVAAAMVTTVPDAPTALVATASGSTQINLSWTAPASTGGSAITGYKIEVSPNGTSGWTDQVANTNSTATTYAHTGLASGDTRHYRVSAINANGSGAASNVDSATTGTTVPGAPSGLTATASGSTQINLSWTAPASTGGSAITGYRIEVSPNGASLRLDRPGRQHQQHHHHLRAHRARRRRHPPLPRLRHQHQRHRRPLQCRQRHHRHHRARRPQRPHGNGQREHPDRPLLERPGEHRRLRHHRLQDRGLLQWRHVVDHPRRRHRQRQHHLPAHRPDRPEHPPLPRLRHQRQRQRHRLQRRQRHHRHHRARRPQRPVGHGQREHPDQPLLERPRQRRRLRHHRLQDRGLLQWRLQLDRPGRQHRQHHHHLRAHRACPRQYPPLPRLRHQHQRQRHRLQRRQRHHGPDDGHVRHAERAHR